MDTVQLEGKYFKTMVTQGDKVKAGQTLIEFYPEKIRAAGYRTITPVVVTNTGVMVLLPMQALLTLMNCC